MLQRNYVLEWNLYSLRVARLLPFCFPLRSPASVLVMERTSRRLSFKVPPLNDPTPIRNPFSLFLLSDLGELVLRSCFNVG